MRTIAIIGASADREKYGNKAVRAYQKKGWQVFPVNSKGGEIEGLRVYKSILDIPSPIGRASLYLPSAIGLSVLHEIAHKRPKEVYFNPGSESDTLIRESKALGLRPRMACSIVAIGEKPADY